MLVFNNTIKKIASVVAGLSMVIGISAANKGGKSGSSDFHKHSAFIDFTIGCPTNPYTDNRKVMAPPISAALEIGAIEGLTKTGKGAIGFGFITSYYLDDCWGYKRNHYYNGIYYSNVYYDAEVHNIFVALRGAFHYEPVTRLDVYGGLMFGGHWKHWNYQQGADFRRFDGKNPVRNKFCFGPYVGVHYRFTQVFGLKAEFGGDTGAGMPYAQAGITFLTK